ncbi:MAG: hypothetical protein D6707_07500, partial [Bacteroidetes bacterium]
MKKKIFLFFILLTISQLVNSQEKQYLIVSYNVENLFDIYDDPNTRDEDFTPGGKYGWKEGLYNKKLADIARVLGAIDSVNLPTVIGLYEVENRKVVEDLSHTGPLANQYGIIHKESPDKRGIDVAMLYKKGSFKPLHYSFYRVHLPDNDSATTRDILYVQGIIEQDTLNFFLNHWPSRWGGKSRSEIRRVAAAKLVREKVDSLFDVNPHAKIIIMGDFNDYPFDVSIYRFLNATNQRCPESERELYNLAAELAVNGLGSHAYKGEWGMLDQIIISRVLFNDTTGLHTTQKDFHVFKPNWILYHNKKYDSYKPNRT